MLLQFNSKSTNLTSRLLYHHVARIIHHDSTSSPIETVIVNHCELAWNLRLHCLISNPLLKTFHSQGSLLPLTPTTLRSNGMPLRSEHLVPSLCGCLLLYLLYVLLLLLVI